MNPLPFPVAELWEFGWGSIPWQQGRTLGLTGWQEAGAVATQRVLNQSGPLKSHEPHLKMLFRNIL